MHVLSSPMEECASGPLAGATIPKHRQTLLSTAVVKCCSPPFAASVCPTAFWCHLWHVCQSAVFSQMGTGEGLVPGEHCIR